MTRWDDALFRCFAQVAEKRSFTSAAAALSLTQPAVTTRIRRLEESLGYALFSRTTRDVALTPRGKLLFERVKSALQETDECLRLATELLHEGEQTLRIGAVVLGAAFRCEVVDRFIALHPKTTVEIEIGATPQILDRLTTGEFDVGFTARSDDEARFDQLCALTLPIGFLIPQDSPLASSPELSHEALRATGVAVPKPSAHPEFHRVLHKFLSEAGIPQRILPYGTSSDLIEFARRTGSVTAIGGNIAADDWLPAGLAFRKAAQLDSSLELAFVRRHGDSRAPVLAFWRMLSDMRNISL